MLELIHSLLCFVLEGIKAGGKKYLDALKGVPECDEESCKLTVTGGKILTPFLGSKSKDRVMKFKGIHTTQDGSGTRLWEWTLVLRVTRESGPEDRNRIALSGSFKHLTDQAHPGVDRGFRSTRTVTFANDILAKKEPGEEESDGDDDQEESKVEDDDDQEESKVEDDDTMMMDVAESNRTIEVKKWFTSKDIEETNAHEILCIPSNGVHKTQTEQYACDDNTGIA